MTGTLFVVATPIGHLGDLSPRAAEILRSVAVIAAEDTRETRKLADAAGSSASLQSCHAHSPPERLADLVGVLLGGQDIALTTDAGTPGVSDPGPRLVAAARAAGCPVIPIPGPSAVATALMTSGLPADRYLFLGFAPRRGRERVAWLDRIKSAGETVVCFEAPGRVGALLADLRQACGDERPAFLGREMTKRFEDYRAGTLGSLADGLGDQPVRGEVTLVVGAGPEEVGAPDESGAVELAEALIEAGVERSRAARIVAKVCGLGRNESYRLIAER